MKLCVPLSDAFRSRQEALLPLVDAVSFKQAGEEEFPSKELFLEPSFNIADPEFPMKLEAARILGALRSGKYASFACDIGPNCMTERRYSSNRFPRAMPLSGAISDEEYLERTARNAEWLRGQFPGHIHVENLNYFSTGAYECVCEPAFIRRVTEGAGIGLLLDIPHAMISAMNLGYEDVQAYLRELPLGSVREIHLSHAGMLNGEMEDLHEVPTECDLWIVEEILAAGAPVEFLTIEYYRDPDILCSVYQSLDRHFSGTDSSAVERGMQP